MIIPPDFGGTVTHNLYISTYNGNYSHSMEMMTFNKTG
jgi:hypothetical protein